jgi:hypothetical protein
MPEKVVQAAYEGAEEGWVKARLFSLEDRGYSWREGQVLEMDCEAAMGSEGRDPHGLYNCFPRHPLQNPRFLPWQSLHHASSGLLCQRARLEESAQQ